MNFTLRKTNINDLEKVMVIYKNARDFMRENNNPDQWGDYWPTKEKIEEDIKKQISYVVVDDNKVIVAVFAFVIGVDPTYIKMNEGSWIANDEYGTVHRLASSFTHHGVFSFIQIELERITEGKINFRIDTHMNNTPMRKAIIKNGYLYCGIITPIEGGERLAFEKVIKK